MSIVIRTRPRRSYLVRRLLQRARVMLGGLLIVGAAGTSLATLLIPLLFLFVVVFADGSPLGALPGMVGKAWAIALVITGCGWPTGRYLMRSRRGTVLWLRRFRYDEATRVVSAALDYIGRGWRVVTLDDAATRPVGVPVPVRLSSAFVGWAGRVFSRFHSGFSSAGPGMAAGSLVGLIAVAAWIFSEGGLEALLAALPWRGGTPADSTQAFLLWMFGGVLLAEVAVLVASLVIPLVSFPLIGWIAGITALREAVGRGEAAKTLSVRTSDDLAAASRAIQQASRRSLGPRLMVVTVEDPLWRETITRLGREATAVLVDVSRVTEHLTWEVDEMARVAQAPPIFVGRHDRLLRLTGVTPSDEVDPHIAARFDHLRRRLDGQEVLAYVTTILGKLRFQRALFAELEARAPRADRGWRDLARPVLAAVGVAAFMLAVRAAVLMVSTPF